MTNTPDLANSTDSMVFALPAQVRAPQLDGDALLPIARKRAPDPSVFDETPPFFWVAEISNDNLDSYFSRMHDSTLKNFARDATKGVSFQNSHDWRSLGLGHSLTGEFLDDGKRHRVEAAFYTVPGIRLNEVATDDFIKGVRSGVLRDVSVGFHGGTIRCGICRGELFSFWGMYFGDCEHVPGLKYDVDGKKVLAEAWHHDGELSEVSIVYDGATPDAGILKAQLMAEAGRLTPEDARYLEATPLYQRHRATFPGVRHVYGITTGGPMTRNANTSARDAAIELEATPEVTEETTETEIPEETVVEEVAAEATEVPEAVIAPAPEDALAEERARLATHGIRLGRDAVGAVRVLADALISARAAHDALNDEMTSLRAEAADGRAYRADLVAQLHAEGVRALGSERYSRERWERLAGSMSIADLQEQIAEYRDKGMLRFPGGRETHEHDAERDRTGVRDRSEVPDAAYRAG